MAPVPWLALDPYALAGLSPPSFGVGSRIAALTSVRDDDDPIGRVITPSRLKLMVDDGSPAVQWTMWDSHGRSCG